MSKKKKKEEKAAKKFIKGLKDVGKSLLKGGKDKKKAQKEIDDAKDKDPE